MGELPTGTVTFLFTDLENSTRLWDEYPEEMNAALARHDEILRAAVMGHGGEVVKTTGDGLHAVFGTAEAGVGAAVESQRALAAEAWGSIGLLRVRMGLHTGMAEQRNGDYFGPVLNRAARLMSAAHAGQVLCSQVTADLVRDSIPGDVGFVELGSHRLRGLERPEVVFQITAADLPAQFPPLSTAVLVAGNLPRQPTSFVGHDEDLLSIAAELVETPVVTLTGVGGVGKTRLALEVAELVAPEYRDGAWLCDLSGVRDGAAVSDAVLEAFGVEPQPGESASRALLRFLRAKELVLVLDNCEHLLKPAAGIVREIVAASAEVRVLATSREGLGIGGERMFAVASLDVPGEAEDCLDAIVGCEAVRLFAERAGAVRHGFVVDSDNAAAVAQICQRLDGVPLAIELAAARVALLTPNDLARRLDQRFRLLTGSERGAVERHQTLRAAIDWSYDLLDDMERRLLDRLSVFVGGFTLEAAERVTSGGGIDPSQVFELLAGLVARSLVLADTSGVEARYRLLETIRQYAQERLELRGDTKRVRSEHAAYYIGLAEQAITALLTKAEPYWFEVGTREVDNVRAALASAIEAGDAGLVLRPFVRDTGWAESGWGAESGSSIEFTRAVRAFSTAVLGVPGVADDFRYPVVLASAAVEAAWRGDLDETHRYLDEAIAVAARLGMEHDSGVVGAEAWVALVEGDLDAYRRIVDESTGWWRARGDGARLALALSSSALARALAGDEMTVAMAEVDEALSLAHAAQVPRVLVTVQSSAAFVVADVQPERARELMHAALKTTKHGDLSPVPAVLGDVAERLGDEHLALELFVAGMEAFHWLGHSEVLGRMLRRIGLLLIDSDPQTAALLIGAGTARSRAATLTERVKEQHRRGIEALEAALGPDGCQELMSQGTLMDENDAVAAARAAATNALSNTKY